jgi:hypothetical protein
MRTASSTCGRMAAGIARMSGWNSVLISCWYFHSCSGEPSQILGSIRWRSWALRNPVRPSAEWMDPGVANRNIARAGSGILVPRKRRKIVPKVLSKKGCSNGPHAKNATRPPGLSTRNISFNAVSTSAKNIIPQRQVIRSKQEPEKGNRCTSARTNLSLGPKLISSAWRLARSRLERELSSATALPSVKR